MGSVLIAPLAIFVELETVRMSLLIFLGRIIAALALGAGQRDQCTHEYSFLPVSKAMVDYTHECQWNHWRDLNFTDPANAEVI